MTKDSSMRKRFKQGLKAFRKNGLLVDDLRPLLQDMCRDLKGYGELLFSYDTRSDRLQMATRITELCGAGKVPEAIRKDCEDIVELGDWYCGNPGEIVDFFQHLTEHRHDTSWQSSRSRLWVSCHYTRYDRPDLAKHLKREYGLGTHTSHKLYAIDTGIARLVELVRLLGGDPDVSCEGHPQGTYLRAVLPTPEAVEMFRCLCAMQNDTVWKMESADSPFEKLVPNSEQMFTIRVVRDVVGCYDDRDTILEESVALIEKQFGIARTTLPPDTDNLWLVNRDTN